MEFDLILIGIKQGKEESLKILFDCYYPELVRYAQNYLYDKMESEGLVQEMFIYLWENASKIEIKTSLQAYLYRSVKNRCLNYLRDLKISDNCGAIEKLAEEEFHNELKNNKYNSSKHQEVMEVVETFPQNMHEIFRLKYFSNYTYDEIASELKISVNTVKTQLKRAKKKLKFIAPLLYWIFLYLH